MSVTKVRDIVSAIERRVPASWAEEWDNCGLLVGDPDIEVERIGVALDATEETIAEAHANGCALLVTHHPAIFKPLSRVACASPTERAVWAAASRGVCVMSLHTNWDSSPEGVNVVLARELGLSNVEPLVAPRSGEWGSGAIGDLAEEMTLLELASLAKESWGLSWASALYDARVVGDGGIDLDASRVRRVALCGGAGSSFLSDASRADAYITADISYHSRLDARAMGLQLVECGHGEMESAALPALASVVSDACGVDAILLDTSRSALGPIFLV